jgi:hypothetical protein
MLPAIWGCSTVMVAGGLGHDAGSVGVSGIETGMGGQLELIDYRSAPSPWGFGPAVALAGYSTANDADPIGFATYDVRHRRPFGTTAARGAYWEWGTGAGVAWSAGIRGAAFPVQGEIGMQKRVGAVTWSWGVRERFIGVLGTGSPAWDPFNSVQVVVGVRRE